MVSGSGAGHGTPQTTTNGGRGPSGHWKIASGSERKYSYGVSLLIVLAKSKAAGPKGKAILDSVWDSSKTRMKDSEILHLMEHVSVIEVIEGVSSPAPQARPQDTDMLRVLKREILAARLKVVL